jgi:hypothetical protein
MGRGARSLQIGHRRLRFFAGRLGAARFLAGRADFFAGRFAAFFGDDFFRAAFFAVFLAAFLAVFFLAAGAFRAGFGVAGISGMARSGARAGMANVGIGGGAGIGSLDIGESSIHPPLVQPVSISSSPDIGAPLARGAALPPVGEGAEAPM